MSAGAKFASYKKLLGTKGIATRSKKLLVAPGHTTSDKKLLVASELHGYSDRKACHRERFRESIYGQCAIPHVLTWQNDNSVLHCFALLSVLNKHWIDPQQTYRQVCWNKQVLKNSKGSMFQTIITS